MSTNPNTFTSFNSEVAKRRSMGADERRKVVLSFMAEHGLVLKPADVYRNLRLHKQITFGSETVKNILHELTEKGYTRRVDPKQIKDRELVDMERGEGRGAYIITEDGIEANELESIDDSA